MLLSLVYFPVILVFTTSCRASFLFAKSRVGPLEGLNRATLPKFANFLQLLQRQAIFYASKNEPEAVTPEAFNLSTKQLAAILKDAEKVTAAVPFNDLAQSYMFLDKADVAKIEQLSRLCARGEGLLEADSSLCKDLPTILFKTVESRVNLITYYVLNSAELLQIPEGWIQHVEHVRDGCLRAGMQPSESLGFVLTLLRHHAKLPEVIENGKIAAAAEASNVLAVKRSEVKVVSKIRQGKGSLAT